MRKYILAIVVVVLAALDWAALHDIIKGNEPNYFGEYTMLVLSAVAFAAIALFLILFREKK